MNYYAVDGNGNITMACSDSKTAEEYGLKLTTDREIIWDYQGRLCFADEAPVKPVTFEDYDNALEAHLKAEQTERGYTTRSPAEYADSTNARWAQDAQDWVAHVTAVMEYGLEVENKAKAGENVPTLEEFKAALPKIEWTYKEVDNV